jgi:hypothetical protein
MVSAMFDRCIRKAINIGDDLFPCDCMEILKDEYKGRLDIMLPNTLIKMVNDLMHTLTDADYNKEATEVVYDFINS